MEQKHRVGIYLSSDVLLRDPDYLPLLRDRLGLNLVVLSFSGALPSDVLKQTPFDAFPLSDACLESLVSRHLDGRPVDSREFDRVRACVGPGVRPGGDDARFRRAIDRVHEVGADVWICGGAWTERRLMLCPASEPVNAWYEALYTCWAAGYDAEGLDITHARYPMGSFPLGMFACTCARCARAAQDLGYDMEAMKAALHDALHRLRALDADRLVSASRTGLGLFDFLQILGFRPGVLDWFRFRADLLTRNLARFRNAVHQAAPGVLFGADTYPASLSLLMGHNHARWAEGSDFASPLVSHVPQFVVESLIAWAHFLAETVPGLSEPDALHVVYRFAGYDGLGLPDTAEAYGLDDLHAMFRRIPLADLVLHDLVKARLYLPPDLPSYPILHGEGWPLHAIETIRDTALSIGHNGVIWQGTRELIERPPCPPNP